MQKSQLKVVAHVRGGKLVKGILRHLDGEDIEDIVRHDLFKHGPEVPIHACDSSEQVNLGLDSLKALFFVKSFEGSPDYSEVKFFHSNPAVEGLWVQVKFHDGEVIEGILHNSVRHVLDAGFFLKPPDPLSNNKLIYVLKKSLEDFRVLGVRSHY